MSETIELSRETYKKIKGMNKVQMAAFLSDIYESAEEEAEFCAIDFDVLKSEIGKIKGIGASRLDEIMNVIQKCVCNNENGETNVKK